jgi:hypothetical protein
MIKRLVPALAALAAITAMAGATDTSSLSAFVTSCSTDAKGCHSMTLNAIITARGANYGCIPKDLNNDWAADKLLSWLKNTANADPKYAKDALPDLMWTGIDEVWPCKK